MQQIGEHLQRFVAPAEPDQGAIAGNQKAMDEFASMFAGALPVPVFFSPAHIGSLVGPATEPR